MTENPRRIIRQIREVLVKNILLGPTPTPDEMALLSQEYQSVWCTEDAELSALLDEPGRPSTKPTTPAEYAFDQKTEQLHRRKRWFESEQLAALTRMERLLAGDERWRRDVLKQNRNLEQRIDACRVECEQAITPIEAAAARRRLLEYQKARQANLKELAERDRMQRKLLSAVRRNATAYLGLVKRLEARNDYRKLLHKQVRANSGGLGLFGTLGAILAIHRFQKMADGIDKLTRKK